MRPATSPHAAAALSVRPARPHEAALIHRFTCELAEYEKLRHEVVASVQDFERVLFGPGPRLFCDIVELEGAPVGMAIWFYNFSTFVGRHGLYLEDLYVTPAARGRGAGKALLVRLARRCVEEGLGRLEWAVLDWNSPAIAFYDSLQARAMSGWIVRRLDGAALRRLAEA